MSAASRLYACHFGSGLQDQWPRLASVLAHTAARHCPDWTVHVEQLRPPATIRRAPSLTSGDVHNTWKLDRWCDIVLAAADGEQLLLIDVDTVILQPLLPVWAVPFDVAYTVRPDASRFPLNAGVVFLRVNDRARAFLKSWRNENRRMLNDPQLHSRFRRRYAGMNQAALGSLLESREKVAGVALARLPCREWNCEDSTWESFSGTATRILHVKSQLRLAIFQGVPARPHLRPLVARWRGLEREAVHVSGAGTQKSEAV